LAGSEGFIRSAEAREKPLYLMAEESEKADKAFEKVFSPTSDDEGAGGITEHDRRLVAEAN